MATSEEGSRLSSATSLNQRAISPHAHLPGAREELLLGRLKEAVAARDLSRAVYLLVTELGGDPLEEELAVCDTTTGRILGYLVPAEERYALHTVEDIRGMAEDARDFPGSPRV